MRVFSGYGSSLPGPDVIPNAGELLMCCEAESPSRADDDGRMVIDDARRTNIVVATLAEIAEGATSTAEIARCAFFELADLSRLR